MLFRSGFPDCMTFSSNGSKSLIEEIRGCRPELLIAVDHEGGRVQRFQDGFTRLPRASVFREVADASLAEQAGWLMAAELRCIGVDFSFAPVLDVESGISRVIGDRAFGQSAEEVTRYAGAFMKGMHRAGMAVVGKHFPGHGNADSDSHLTLPTITQTRSEMDSVELYPFKRLIDAGVSSMMVAHLHVPAMDSTPNLPSTQIGRAHV